MVKNKEGSFRIVMIFMLISLVIAFQWDKWVAVKNAVHYVLDPSAGVLLNWNMLWGMIFIVLVLAVIMTIVQKYSTNQVELKRLKKEQKDLQKQVKALKHDPKKSMEIQKQIMPLTMKQMKLSMRSIAYTGIPFVLLYRWFYDYFGDIALVTGEPVRFLGFMGWVIFYLVATLAFSSIIRKYMKVV